MLRFFHRDGAVSVRGLVTCLVLAFPLVLHCGAPDALADDVITLSRPTKEIKKEHARLHPIAVWLGEQLQGQGISRGEVFFEGKNSISATSALVNEGAIDLVFETPYSALAIMEDTGAEPLLLVTRDGAREYHSVIFTRKDSGIDSLADMAGKTIVFEEPGSTSAYHLPRKALQNAGLELAPLASPEETPDAGAVGFVFGGSELNISSWVFFGRVHAGALSNLDWPAQDENPERFRKEFQIIHRTKDVPRMFVLARKGLSPDLKDAVKRALIDMTSTPEGREALKLYKINGFSSIDDPVQYIVNLKEALPGTAD